MAWTANFDKDGNIKLEPDTPETRRDLEQTLHDFHAGRLEIESAEWVPEGK